jgi:poly-beta-1,6-N-acetyl-D-glucosamine synthase
MAIFYLLFGIVYTGLLVGLFLLWQRKYTNPLKGIESPMVSLLVPFRNENEILGLFFKRTISLSYRNLEVLFINDHSNDGGNEVLQGLIDNHPSLPFPVYILENKGIGKKAAIDTGIASAQGDLIFCTDADCLVPENWIENKLGLFENPKVKMVGGPVMTSGQKGFFQKFQQIDWASILLVTKAGFEINSPLMCSAANLAYRKSAFLEVDGFQGNDMILSGDDEFLLKKFAKKFGPESVVYQNHMEDLVYTQPQQNWRSLFDQRSRWASKWNTHGSFNHLLGSIIPVLFQFVFLSSFLLLFIGALDLWVFVFIWIAKVGSERIVLGKVLSQYGIKHHFFWFFLVSVFHPFYVIIIVFRILFFKNEWKGRRVNSNI